MLIKLLVTDPFDGMLPPGYPDHASLYERLLRPLDPELRIEQFEAYKGVLPEPSGNPRCLHIITGSRAGVYEPRPWIRSLLQWIRDAKEEGVALAGICFGCQAIAQALGGRVIHHPNGWGLGLRRSRVVSPRLRAYLPEDTLLLSYDHGDQVVELPEGAERLATSDFCTHDAFALGDRILAFQGHPEFPLPYMEWFLGANTGNESPEFRGKVKESFALGTPQGPAIARMMLDLARQAS